MLIARQIINVFQIVLIKVTNTDIAKIFAHGVIN